MTTLKKARKDGDLEKFIKEHENDAPGDTDKLDAAIKRKSPGTSKAVPKASSGDASDD